MRRIASLTAALCLTVATVVLAAPAHAVSAGTITISGSGASPTALAGTVGDTFNLANGMGLGASIVLIDNSGQFSGIAATSCATARPQCAVAVGSQSFSVLGEGSANVYEWIAGSTTGALLATIYVNASGVDPTPSADSSASTSISTESPTPPAIIQQFGKPSSGTCEALAPESLNWGGAGSGGWGESWGRWEGYEGPVCTRMLVYSNTLGHWTVA